MTEYDPRDVSSDARNYAQTCRFRGLSFRDAVKALQEEWAALCHEEAREVREEKVPR